MFLRQGKKRSGFGKARYRFIMLNQGIVEGPLSFWQIRILWIFQIVRIPAMSVVTSKEFQRNLGRYQDKALAEPITITKNGRERLVLLSVEEYQRLKRRDRRVGLTTELPDEWLEALEKAKSPDESRNLDEGLKDWKP
jgi:prevent-host-death family protein